MLRHGLGRSMCSPVVVSSLFISLTDSHHSDNDRDSDWVSGNMASKKSSKLNKVFLSTEQQQVLGMVLEQGKNIFFTGSAGMSLMLDLPLSY